MGAVNELVVIFNFWTHFHPIILTWWIYKISKGFKISRLISELSFFSGWKSVSRNSDERFIPPTSFKYDWRIRRLNTIGEFVIWIRLENSSFEYDRLENSSFEIVTREKFVTWMHYISHHTSMSEKRKSVHTEDFSLTWEKNSSCYDSPTTRFVMYYWGKRICHNDTAANSWHQTKSDHHIAHTLVALWEEKKTKFLDDLKTMYLDTYILLSSCKMTNGWIWVRSPNIFWDRMKTYRDTRNMMLSKEDFHTL